MNRAILPLLFVAFLMSGCAAVLNASLATTAALSSARADAVTMLVRVDQTKQAEYRAKAKAATLMTQVDALEAEQKAYILQRDKALLGLDKLGNALAILKDAIAVIISSGKGSLDLAPAFAAFNEAKALLSGLGLNLPGVLR